MQCACTSTVLMRLPAITTSQRRVSCACPPEPPPALALVPALTDAVNSQSVNMIPLLRSLAPISLPPLLHPARPGAAEPTPDARRMPTRLVALGSRGPHRRLYRLRKTTHRTSRTGR